MIKLSAVTRITDAETHDLTYTELDKRVRTDLARGLVNELLGILEIDQTRESSWRRTQYKTEVYILESPEQLEEEVERRVKKKLEQLLLTIGTNEYSPEVKRELEEDARPTKETLVELTTRILENR